MAFISAFILKFNWRYDFPADTASVSCDSRGGSTSSIGNVSYFETDSEAFDIYQINRGIFYFIFLINEVHLQRWRFFIAYFYNVKGYGCAIMIFKISMWQHVTDNSLLRIVPSFFFLKQII